LGSSLQMLAQEVAGKRAEIDSQNISLEELQDEIDLLRRIRAGEEQNRQAFERMQKIGLLRRESQALRLDTEGLNRRKDELDRREEGLRSSRQHFDRAGPALKRLVQALSDAEVKITSAPLRQHLNRTLPLKAINKWLDFHADYAFAPHAVYASLAKNLNETPNGATFPITDELTGFRAESIEQLEELFEEHAKWSRSFTQLLEPHLARFSREVDGCDDIAAENLDELEADLVGDENFFEKEQSAYYSELEALQDRSNKFAELIGIEDLEDLDFAIERAEEAAAQLAQEVGPWRLGKESIATLVGSLRIDSDEFWALGGAETQLAILAEAFAEQSEILHKVEAELAPLEEEFNRKRLEAETSREHRFAQALSLLEYTNIEIRNHLSPGVEALDVDFSDLRTWNPQDMLPEPVDVLAPLKQGITELVSDRCGSYYTLTVDGTWSTQKVTDLDLRAATLRTEYGGAEKIVRINEELGTGVRAAMTVRSLASRTHSPGYISVLLVDEWGDVEQHTLAQTVYADIQTLPNPVVGLFSLPGSSASAILHDAQTQ
jgi:hypothetical protein